MLEFIGRFHPVFVHLPIGILLLACIFIILSFKTQFSGLKASIPITLLLGALSAIVSCLTGYFLANSGDYDGKLVSNHQWMGISVAVIAIILWVIYKKITSNFLLGTIALTLIILISVTGHMGGSLTHGSDYLTAPLQGGGDKNKAAIPAIANVQEAFVYQNAIQPLLQSRCYSCHGAEKQKGKLRLDNQEFILKGGENGKTVVPGKADESELIKRLLLPLTDDDHMAPKEKPQLTTNEIELLKWWINNGADFNKKFKDLPQPATIKPVLAGLQTGSVVDEKAKAGDLPLKEIDPADEKALATLANANIMVVPVAQNSNYLSANFVNVTNFSDSVTKGIKKIKDQLLWVKADNKLVNDAALKTFSDCKNITRLSLNGSNITDAGLVHLKDLQNLQSLSLVGTKIGVLGINQLKQIKSLKWLYVYQTNVKNSDLVNIKRVFPNAKLDTGNYQVSTIAQDTTEVKPQSEEKK